MIERVKASLNKRNVKLFSVFLLGSSIAWFISHLAEHYISDTTFEVHYGHPPDSLLLRGTDKDHINVRLNASGFQLLLFSLKRREVQVDLSSLERTGNKYFVPPRQYRKQIEAQLSKSITILDMDRDTMFFNFEKRFYRKIPVVSLINVDLGQHYMLDKNMRLVPDSITVIGPAEEISGILKVDTKAVSIAPRTPDFSETVALEIPAHSQNVSFSQEQVVVQGKVFKFSERIIQVPITVVHVPESLSVRTFPEMASVLCRGRIQVLRGIQESDFEVAADYATFNEEEGNILPLKLTKKWDSISVVQLKDDKVEFILMKK